METSTLKEVDLRERLSHLTVELPLLLERPFRAFLDSGALTQGGASLCPGLTWAALSGLEPQSHLF
jgi:hypothetical protein